MSVIQERNNLGDLVKYEEESLNYSRDQVNVAAGENLSLGAVVGRVTASGEIKALDPAATDGSESAVGVLVADCDATTAARTDGVLLARHAVVARSALVWPAGINPVQQAAAVAQLHALGVLVRTSV